MATSTTIAAGGWICVIDWIEATGCGALLAVLQQGCCAAPMRQSPAIFLQQAISAAVIRELGRHASAGVTSQTAIRFNAKIARQRAMTLMLSLNSVQRQAESLDVFPVSSVLALSC